MSGPDERARATMSDTTQQAGSATAGTDGSAHDTADETPFRYTAALAGFLEPGVEGWAGSFNMMLLVVLRERVGMTALERGRTIYRI